jgi:hypothetical protein
MFCVIPSEPTRLEQVQAAHARQGEIARQQVDSLPLLGQDRALPVLVGERAIECEKTVASEWHFGQADGLSASIHASYPSPGVNQGYSFFMHSGQMPWLNSASEWSRT